MTDTADLLVSLRAPGTTLTKTIGAVNSLEKLLELEREAAIGISSNVSVDLLSVYLRKHGLLAGTRVNVRMGSHDDPVTDADEFVKDGLQGMIFIPFFDNLMPAFEQQIEHLSIEQVAAKEADLRARCRLVFHKARALRNVCVCSFHRFGLPVDTGAADVVEDVLAQFNAALREEAAEFPNVRMIDTGAIVQLLGAASTFDARFYLRSTAPYAPAFFNELARRIVMSSRGFNSYYYKALVLDCDNTLWGGIVGEDLINGIQLDPYSYPGKVFWRAQQQFLSLERNGVLLCLCSKNNPTDVDEVLENHPHSVIKKKHIAATRVNWTDKVSNLQALARDLNIGLDSVVFVDDSEFECAAVRTALPMVRVFQIPDTLADYPRVVQEIRELFLSGGISSESRSKTEQYRHRQEAADASAQFVTHEEYLATLNLRVDLGRNEAASAARISELTLKSNQFNLTTLRQTPAEIHEKMESNANIVYSLTVSDRFGSAGLTGVVLTKWTAEVTSVEAFLMSCRVIGRGVEFSFWPAFADDARRRGCKFIEAEYRPTPKNAQVADFYDRVGLPLVDEIDGIKRYRASLDSFNPPTVEWITVNQ